MNDQPNQPSPAGKHFYKVLAAILCDIAKAQDISNKYTVKLAKEYAENSNKETLINFPVPNGYLKELDLEMDIAWENLLNENDQNASEYYRQALAETASRMSREVSDEVASKLKEIEKKIEDSQIKASIQSITTMLLSTGWLQHLSGEVLNAIGDVLKKQKLSKGSPESFEPLLAVFNKKIFENEDVKECLQADDPQHSILSDLKNAIKNKTDEWLREITENMNLYFLESTFPTLTGLVNTSDLQGLASLSKIKLKVELRDYKWMVNSNVRDKDNIEFTVKQLILERS
ncbi:MAG: hypothetical protein HGB15_05695 [Chlorobaculum sp.]|nr:hypothetical protein [Chlorobaculum sp.]